jgi:glycoside/pentoside/hexuronide:cation symporter, GPH family
VLLRLNWFLPAGVGGEGYILMGIVIGAILFLAMIGSFFGTSRVRRVDPVAVTASFREQIRAAAENRPYFILFGAYIIQVLGIGAMLAGVDFFSSYILNDPGQTSILFVCLIGPALITMPLWVRVGHRFGKLTGYIICIILFTVGGLGLMLSNPDQLWLVYFLFLSWAPVMPAHSSFHFRCCRIRSAPIHCGQA